MKQIGSVFAIITVLTTPLTAQVLRLVDLTSAQIRSLDRTSTVVLVPGGMLEEHGPYLPSYTDGILSERLTSTIADSIVASRKGRTVLIFPQIPLGSSGYNEIGGRFSFPGTYAVRPSTLRAIFMDIASELGEQGFEKIFIVHVHGSPRHNRALDEASDFFHDTYGGIMVHVWGLVPVISGWGNAMKDMTPSEKQEDGVSLHAGMDETSMMLYLRPELVDTSYVSAIRFTGKSISESVRIARQPDWPGYIGSPRLGNAAMGRKIWLGFAAAAVDHCLKILDGANPAQFRRYADLLDTLPDFQEWIKASKRVEEQREATQNAWIEKRTKTK